MLTLIGRELRDNFVHLVLAGFISLCTIVIAILTAYWRIAWTSLGIAMVMGIILVILFATLGAAQMYTDRANRISSVLATLAATRSRILVARVLAGAMVILATLVPLLITAIAIAHLEDAPLALYWGTIAEVFATVVLTSFACYCVGLLLGWTTIKAFPALGMLFLMALVVLFVVIKGFVLLAIVLLLLFSVACLAHVWYRFTSVSL
jgi:hypothetical protein